VNRSRFDHLAAEVSVAVGTRIPRYPLWLRLHELGADPEALTRQAALAFCEGPLVRFLVDHGLWLTPRAQRRLLKSVARFDPLRLSPADRLASWEID
jgi:hypothetical protein